MTSATDHLPAGNPRRRGQLKLLAILAVVVGPILIAGLMARFELGIPQSRTNHNALVEPVLSVTDWQLPLESVGYGGPWRLLITVPDECGDECLTLIHEARQIDIATGREANRVEQVLALGETATPELAARLGRDYSHLQQVPLAVQAYRNSLIEHPESWQHGPQLWVVDPLGRVVLHREADKPGKQLLDDLVRLLKMSKVG